MSMKDIKVTAESGWVTLKCSNVQHFWSIIGEGAEVDLTLEEAEVLVKLITEAVHSLKKDA